MSQTSFIVDPFPAGPPRAPPSPPVERLDLPLTTRRVVGLILWLLLGFAATLGAIMALPSAGYVRYQQEAGTIQFHARWVYERIHFDPTPIDVAVIGTSRLEAGVSPVELQKQLTAKLGRPIHVADFALVQMGRNLHYAIAKDLLVTRPEVKLIVLSVEEGAAASHPLFRYVADDGDVVRSPLVLNMSYFDDLFYLPIRHIIYFSESIAPSLFGVDAKFRPQLYLGTDLDRTLGYRLPDGTQVNGMRMEPAVKLAAQAEIVHRNYQSTQRLKRYLAPAQEYAVEYTFTRDLANLAADHHVELAFVHLPMFQGRYAVQDPGFYAHFGPYFDEYAIADRPDLYFDGAHLNRAGAVATSDWLASKLAPYLAIPPKPEAAP